jgi:60 kDa SS-A/Ro ribonucleoprotein
MEDHMASKKLFPGATPSVQSADTVNEAGGRAYAMEPKIALAQLAVTGCLSNTFYTSDKQQLESVVKVAKECDPAYVAKVALYAREKGFMKDMPAFLVAFLAVQSPSLLKEVFPRVMNNGKMLRNFVQMIRSGVLGRKSFGTAPKRVVHQWFESKTDSFIFRNSIGNDPSMADVLKLLRPVPKTASRSALYAYLLGKETFKFEGKEMSTAEALPQEVKDYLAFKESPSACAVPQNVPYEMLEGIEGLTATGWAQLAQRATWSQTRQHLNTFLRHGVFNDAKLTKAVAARLSNKEEIVKAKCFPYQLMSAFMNVEDTMPQGITLALQEAMEVATANIPKIEGTVIVCPDVSGSMGYSVTGESDGFGGFAQKNGHKMGKTSKTRCIDVAALVSACILRTNKESVVIPFEERVVSRLKLNPMDSVMTNAQKLAGVGGGGTNCSAPLAFLNENKVTPDVVIFISDYESWVDSPRAHTGSAMLAEWQKIVKRNPKAKLICIDVTPTTTHQLPDRPGILRIGGFSDTVFNVISAFLSGDVTTWVKAIESHQ